MWHISLITSLENELILKNSKIMFGLKHKNINLLNSIKPRKKFFNVILKKNGILLKISKFDINM